MATLYEVMIWEVTNSYLPELCIGRSVEIVERYCGRKGRVAKKI